MIHTETTAKNFGNLSILQIELIKKWKVLNSQPTDVLGLASRPNLTRSDFDCSNLSKAKSKVITWKLLFSGGGWWWTFGRGICYGGYIYVNYSVLLRKVLQCKLVNVHAASKILKQLLHQQFKQSQSLKYAANTKNCVMFVQRVNKMLICRKGMHTKWKSISYHQGTVLNVIVTEAKMKQVYLRRSLGIHIQIVL